MAEHGGDPPQHRQGERHQRACRELPRPGVRPEVGPGLSHPGLPDRQGERDHQHQAEPGPDAPPRVPRRPPPAGQQDPADEQEQRPHQVELLLDGQRPEVLQHRRGALGREVVGAVDGELDVHRVRRGPERVAGEVPRRQRRLEQVREHAGDDHDRDGGGEQPADPPGVEAPEADPSGRVELAQQVVGDQEAGDDEEDVDPDVATGEPGDAGVREHHGEHRDRPHALDVSPERTARRRAGQRRRGDVVVDARRLLGDVRVPGRRIRGRAHAFADPDAMVNPTSTLWRVPQPVDCTLSSPTYRSRVLRYRCSSVDSGAIT